jgi:adenylate cyclase
MMATTRRLAAILAADVAGYSRLMGLDEEGTHERYTSHLRELITPKIRQHRGRIVKSTGDGMLAEFPSVVDAVLCAVEVQCGMGPRNADVEEDMRVAFRIGINVSDVIAETGDIFGDGVNIAARLEGLAEPNGICISHAVHEQVRDRLPYAFDDLGVQNVKNIARPLHAYALRAETIAALPIANTPPAALADLGGSLGLPQPRAPRLSIVVLPFANLNDDREQQYLADAITDDVTIDLSRIVDMIVISRNTAFTYRGKPVDTRQIGRDLNVRYVLEGSVRRSGNRIRVNTQLIDAENDVHVWADRSDHTSDNPFRLQDEVTGRIAVALNLELIGAEAARPTDNPDALDYIFRGRAALNKGSIHENFLDAIQLLESALKLDPQSIDARVFLAHALVGRVLEQFSETMTADLDRAERLIGEAMASPRRQSLAHLWKGQLLRARGRYRAAIPEYETALAADRNSVLALAALGQCRFFSGLLEEVIPAQEQAIRLSPADPYLPNWHWRIGMVHLLQSRIDESVFWLERARSANPRLAGPHAWLVSAYALQGDLRRAGNEFAEACRLSGDNRYASIAAFKAAQPFETASISMLAEETFFSGLRKAGVPEK